MLWQENVTKSPKVAGYQTNEQKESVQTMQDLCRRRCLPVVQREYFHDQLAGAPVHCGPAELPDCAESGRYGER